MRAARITFANSIWLLFWPAILYSTLQFYRFQGIVGHSICGPWGCAAMPEALLGYHLFWAFLLCPAAWAISRFVNLQPRPLLPASLIGLGSCMLIGLMWLAGANWLAEKGDPQYLRQRIGFVVATSVDVPAVQIILAGALAWLGGRRQRSTEPQL